MNMSVAGAPPETLPPEASARVAPARPESPKGREDGFSLVELLVVVIIVGILAAIAIPTFVSQREQALSAAVQTDLRNAATSASACASDNDGSYTACNPATLRTDYDFTPTDGVALSGVTASPTRWAAEARHTANPAATVHHFDTQNGSQVREGPVPASP
jgi:type IV pilus assembly protein PilA